MEQYICNYVINFRYIYIHQWMSLRVGSQKIVQTRGDKALSKTVSLLAIELSLHGF